MDDHRGPQETDVADDARILLVGDAHGNVQYLDRAIRTALRLGISRIVQVGDFGVWSGSSGYRFLTSLAELTASSGLTIEFVDGNHDNHDHLAELAGIAECRMPDGSVEIAHGVRWWPRGTVTTIAGRRVGFLGGAVSVDRHRRVEGISWWSGEDVSDRDVAALVGACADTPLDVLVCHDAPAGIELPSWDGWPADARYDAARTRERLRGAVAATRPKLVVHGHWHVRHRTTCDYDHGPVVVFGLGHESDDGLAALDVATGRVDDLGVRFPAAWQLLDT